LIRNIITGENTREDAKADCAKYAPPPSRRLLEKCKRNVQLFSFSSKETVFSESGGIISTPVAATPEDSSSQKRVLSAHQEA